MSVQAGLIAGAAVGAVALKVCGCDPKKAAGAAVAGFVVAAGVCSFCGCCQKKEKKTTNQLVTESWATVKSAFSLEDVGKLFYKNLFTHVAPGAKDTIFGDTDHGMQPKKLMSFVDKAIGMLDQPDKLVPFLVACGERHGAYGKNGNWIEKEHYPLVGQALLMTLEQGLGDKFTPEVKAAWTEIYGVIQAKFIEGQYNEKGLANRARAEAKLKGGKKSTAELVTESWATVKSAFALEDVGKLFYKNLFTHVAPGAKDTIFGDTDHAMQPKKLMTWIDKAIGMLEQPDKLVPYLVACGERHGAYGKNGNWVEKEHYPLVGQALLMTLEQGLGDKFTPEVKAAWTEIYGVIQAKFIEGQYNEKGLAIRARAEAKLKGQ